MGRAPPVSTSVIIAMCKNPRESMFQSTTARLQGVCSPGAIRGKTVQPRTSGKRDQFGKTEL